MCKVFDYLFYFILLNLLVFFTIERSVIGQSQVTNFDFTNIPIQGQSNGKVHRIGNFNWQQAHFIGEAFNVNNGILTVPQSIDDAALIMDVNNDNYADKDYYIRTTVKLGSFGSFVFAGLLAHADTGGTAHPETEGVALGIMKISGQYHLKLKQWTDGDIYGFGHGNPTLNDFDPNKWYILELHVKPRGVNDTQFDGAIYLTNNQINPTVADIGNGIPLANGSFTNLWNPDTGELDNSDPPQWNPQLQNIAIFQWFGTNHQFSSVGIAKSQIDFARPLIYLDDDSRVAVTGQTLQFKSSPMLEALSYSWDFGEGTSSSSPNPSKTYSSAGIFDVKLQVTYSSGVFESEPLRVIVEPSSGTPNSSDAFNSGLGHWQYEDAGLNGANFSQSESNYINGTMDNGTLKIEAYNYSAGWDMSDSVIQNAGGKWYKPVYMANAGDLTVNFKYKVSAANINSTDRFKIFVLDNDTVVKTIDLTGNQTIGLQSGSSTFNVSSGMHRIGMALWSERLHTNGTVLDPDENSSVRRSNLVTHRFDHMDNNSKIQVWFDDISISTNGNGSGFPKEGEVVATYKIPSVFNSLNGLAWDGTQLWAVDYVDSGSGGKAYRMDITAAQDGSVPAITRTLDLNILGIEGAAHDGANSLYIGPRVNGSRASAQIIEVGDTTGIKGSTYTEFLFPDGQIHGDYKDPDGIAHDGTNIYWVVNGDHSGLPKAGVQVMASDGSIVKRFWLPDQKPNDVAYVSGFLIYKPANNSVIRLINVALSLDGGDADVALTIPITGTSILEHWGAAHDGLNYLYLSHWLPGSTIWKIYLPVGGEGGGTDDTTPPTITSVNASGDPNKVTVVFSEPVEKVSAENILNYQSNNGITISGASLSTDLKTVTLSTSTHSEDITYTLTVNNIRDRASKPNVIVSNTQTSYTFATKLVISNLSVASGKQYEVVSNGINNGNLVYIDRNFTYSNVPASVQGSTYIKTANDDKDLSGDFFLTFTVNQDAKVVVAHDDRLTTKPAWLASFSDVGDDVITTDTTLSCFAKDFPAGTVTLGGNEGRLGSMYAIIILPLGSSSVPPDTIPPLAPENFRIIE